MHYLKLSQWRLKVLGRVSYKRSIIRKEQTTWCVIFSIHLGLRWARLQKTKISYCMDLKFYSWWSQSVLTAFKKIPKRTCLPFFWVKINYLKRLKLFFCNMFLKKLYNLFTKSKVLVSWIKSIYKGIFYSIHFSYNTRIHTRCHGTNV